MKLKSKFVIGIAGAVILGGVGATAMAAIPDSDDQEFHACIPNTGTLRTVFFFDKEATPNPCPAGYSEKAWNQTGPTGPVGPQGATGATGPEGPVGASAAVNIVHVSQAGTVVQVNSENTAGTATATCPTGFVATGGGFNPPGTVTPRQLTLDSNSYTVSFAGGSVGSGFTVTASCIEGVLS